MKNKRLYLWRFTFVRRDTLDVQPEAFVFGYTLKSAQIRFENNFPKSQFDVESVYCVTSHDLVILGLSNYQSLLPNVC